MHVHAIARQLGHEAVGDGLIQLHVPSQDPGELDVGHAQDGLAGVDEGVGVVVRVDHVVVAVRCACKTRAGIRTQAGRQTGRQTYERTRTRVHTQTHARTHTHVCVCVCVCVRACVRACVCVCVCVCV